jgi:hypothetical protein
MSRETYLTRKPRLLKDFDRSITRVKPFLVACYGAEEASILLSDSHQEYEELIPQIPYIGESNPMLNLFLLPASRYLAIYRTYQAHGKTLEAAGRLVYYMGEAEIQALPRLVLRGIEILWFSGWFRDRLQKRAELSQRRRYPGDYVIEYLDGNGQDFDYGIDYLQCASCNFFGAQGAGELLPYICAIDKAASKMCGWGLSRTTTLAQGGERCDFRFKRGRGTYVDLPPSLSLIGS